ncbi:pyridoxamine 5'-phosphate oxidase [Nocardioides insulae]|uniref:pyridoxamine 5'-phosphate oxidase n=1 Tax=Nocardioides insulae TaxID=394734 RepID=UPI00041AFE02|nr:pyridoxamine 5'-phosphate oxidase [Nocardioides insulae]
MLRAEYGEAGLLEEDADPDPMGMFHRWFEETVAAGLPEPNAMIVATGSAVSGPSARYVLLKGVRADGFVFFTNLASHKGADLAADPRCALLFPWHPLERQVRVEGRASLLPAADVAAYFATRPRGSQLGAWASPQSRVVAGRAELEGTYAEMERRFGGAEVPVPEEWGGYLVRPEMMEFWQGRPGRMHDRLCYRRAGSGWRRERLAP